VQLGEWWRCCPSKSVAGGHAASDAIGRRGWSSLSATPRWPQRRCRCGSFVWGFREDDVVSSPLWVFSFWEGFQ
jgi:hypothetical protein